jgi:TIR domain
MTSKAGAVGSGRVFISYSRRDHDAVKAVATELDQLGQEVWLDQELSGGQPWWDTILDQIRNCRCFMFGLSETSLNSLACRAELEYAHALQRPIIPVMVGAPVPDQILPPMLAARALLALPPPPGLPDPLPTPPPVPISYMDEIADRINRDHLTVQEQQVVMADLKLRLRDEDQKVAALTLMRRLRRHPDINAWVAEEIDAELAKLEPAKPATATTVAAQPAPPSVPPPHAPVPPPHAPVQPGPVWYPPPQPAPRPPVQPAWPPGAPPPARKSSNAWIWILIAVLVLSVMFVGCLGLALEEPTTSF